MDFFRQQDRTRRQGQWLICLFGLAVLVTVAVFCFVVAYAIWVFRNPLVKEAWWNPMTMLITAFVTIFQALPDPWQFLKQIWNPNHAVWITLGVLTGIAAGCGYEYRRLIKGGAAVAELLGGRCLSEKPDLADERRLRAVVEEMAIASAVPMPKIYVLDREGGINAFAAGYTREDVAIGVTYGCLKLLTRDELQGVVAHEFSHVLNGDTRLNMHLMALAHGLFWPTIVGRVLLYGSTRPLSSEESPFDSPIDPGQFRVLLAPAAFFFFALGSVGSPLVRFIKSAICRERELHADAAAVQFTRNLAGISAALKKVGGLSKQGRLDTPLAETASHLYFANCRHEPWFKIFSTHPPLTRRLKVLEPGFSGKFARVQPPPSRAAIFDGVYEASLRRARASTANDWSDENR